MLNSHTLCLLQLANMAAPIVLSAAPCGKYWK